MKKKWRWVYDVAFNALVLKCGRKPIVSIYPCPDKSSEFEVSIFQDDGNRLKSLAAAERLALKLARVNVKLDKDTKERIHR